MTYKLSPAIEKILSPVILVFPDGTRREYQNGKAAAEAIFDQKYSIDSLKAFDNIILIQLKKQVSPNIRWVGEEAESFF